MLQVYKFFQYWSLMNGDGPQTVYNWSMICGDPAKKPKTSKLKPQ